jgi:hypothetical protein
MNGLRLRKFDEDAEKSPRSAFRARTDLQVDLSRAGCCDLRAKDPGKWVAGSVVVSPSISIGAFDNSWTLRLTSAG